MTELTELIELKHSFQTKLIEHRFVPVKKKLPIENGTSQSCNSDWYMREENPILYLVSLVDAPEALQNNTFFQHIDELSTSLENSFFSRIIALEIFLGKKPENATSVESDNENVHKIQWYFDYDAKILEAQSDHPTKLLGIEKLLVSALEEPPKVSFLRIRQKANPPYVSYAIFIIWAFLLLDGFVSDTHTSMVVQYGMSRRAITHNEYYRFFTSMFLHADLQHLLSNAIYLYYFGTRLERIYGPAKYLSLYIFCGISANLFSVILNDVLAIGASGATYGLLGATLVLVKKFGTRYTSMNYATILLFAFLGLSIGFFNENIDNFGHIGGVIAGCCFGVTLRDQQTSTITFQKKE